MFRIYHLFFAILIFFNQNTNAEESCLNVNNEAGLSVLIAKPSDEEKIQRDELFEIKVKPFSEEIVKLEIFVNGELTKTLNWNQMKRREIKGKKRVNLYFTLNSDVQEEHYVLIEPGLNRVAVVAWNKKKRCDKDTIEVSAGSNDVQAIIIGLDKYQILNSELKYSTADAEEIRDYLMTELGVPTDNMYIFLNASATKRNIQVGFRELEKKMNSSSTLIVYFSGHGYYSDDENYSDNTFLIPYDGEVRYDFTMLSKRDFVELIKKNKAGRKIFFLDACFAGGTPSNEAITSSTSKSISSNTGSKSVTPHNLWKGLNGIYGMFASRSDEPSWEFDDLKHGVFTHFLLNAIETANDSDGKLTLGETFKYVRYNVKMYVDKFKKKQQTPDEISHGDGRDFIWGVRQ